MGGAECGGGQAGASLAALGDVDGSGRSAFAVAAYYDSASFDYGGVVWIVRGTEAGPLANHTTLEASDDYWFLGTGIDGGQDVDADGQSDLLLGATGYDNGTGLVLLVSGAALGPSVSAAALDVARAGVVGAAPATYLGSRVVFGNDLDGDGVQEVVSSAPLSDSGDAQRAGAV